MSKVVVGIACALMLAAGSALAQQEYRSYDQGEQGGQSYQSSQGTWQGQYGNQGQWEYGPQPRTGRMYGQRYGYEGEYEYEQPAGEGWWEEQPAQEQPWNQGQPESWRMGRQGRFMGQMGFHPGIAAIGRVVQEKAELSGINPSHKLVEIQTRQGTRLFVDLGPSKEAESLKLPENQSIFVHGPLASISGERVIIARQVGKISDLTNLQRGPFMGGQRPSVYGYQGEPQRFRSQRQTGQQGQWKSGTQGQQGQSEQSGQSEESSESGQSGNSGSSGQ